MASIRRSKDVRSSSQGEIECFLSHAAPALLPSVPAKWPPGNNRKRSALANSEPRKKTTASQGRHMIVNNNNINGEKRHVEKENGVPRIRADVVFEVGSAVWESEDSVSKTNQQSDHQRFGGFLQACSLCKKKFKKEADLYMYGYLRAFCSVDCRAHQMDLDGFNKKVSTELAESFYNLRRWFKPI